jgi:hypothetical protein
MILSWVVGCGGGRPEEAEPEAQLPAREVEQLWEQAGEIIDEELGKVAAKEAARFPCSLFEQQEVEALIGNALEPASYTFENISENGHDYQGESCEWFTFADDANEIGLRVSQAKHFQSGSVECKAPSNADSGPHAPRSTPGIGESAWWEYDKSWGMGTLLVCSTAARIRVEVDLATDDETAALAAARTLAERALENV